MNTKSILLVLLLVVIIIVGGYFFVDRDALFSVEQEPAVQVTLGSILDSQLYTVSKGELIEEVVPEESGTISRYRRHDLGQVLSIFTPPGTFVGMLHLDTGDGTGEFLQTSTGITEFASLSPDGAFVAYSRLNLSLDESLYSEDTADWNVYLYDIERNREIDLGVGYAPYFILSNPYYVVAFSTPEGIAAVQYENNGQFKNLFTDRVVDNVTKAARFSPDGKTVALYNEITKRYSIFTITQPESMRVSAVGEVRKTLNPVALSDTHFYGVYWDEETDIRELWRYPLDEVGSIDLEGELLYTFNSDQLPYQIIP